MIGVVIPVHNEENLLGECLHAMRKAVAHPRLANETVHILVVLDSCTDASAQIALAYDVSTLTVDALNIGEARARGVRLLIDQGARWVACANADSVVAEDWLVAQLDQNADVVYDTTGALGSLGFTAQAYTRAGGLHQLAVDDGMELAERLHKRGASSARLNVRVPGGFAEAHTGQQAPV